MTQHQRPAQMPMVAQRLRQANGQRHVAHAAALRRADMASPIGALDAELPFDEIDIIPPQADHVAATQPASPPSKTMSDAVPSCVDATNRSYSSKS